MESTQSQVESKDKPPNGNQQGNIGTSFHIKTFDSIISNTHPFFFLHAV